MMYLMRFMILASFLFAGGCDDQHCMTGDQSRCDDDVIQECDGYLWIDIEDCTESELGPFCGQLEGGDAYCTDGTY